MSKGARHLMGAGLWLFRWLPAPLRRRLVRFGAPSFTVGALCVVLDGDRLLLVRQGYRRGWGAPGGLLDRGEVAEAAAVREVAEETGLAVTLLEPGLASVHPRTRRVDITFRCGPAPGADPQAVRPAPPEILEVGWFPLADLPPLQPDTVTALRLVGLGASIGPQSGPSHRGGRAGEGSLSPSPRRRRNGAPSARTGGGAS